MAIIRNDRRAREEQAETQKAASEGDQMVTDYSWRPSLEEFDPKLSVDDWKALLDDPTVFDEDSLHAVECLHEIGGPTTLQQLSVRYRGTMGRYRRWLNTAGERVGRHLGMDAPTHDQFGNDEWWAFIYQRRGIGKVAANQHELRLRDELGAALDARAAEKKQARHREEQNQAKERERQVRAQAEALRSSNAGGRGAGSQGRTTESSAAEPSAAEQRRAAQEARAARNARLSQITVDSTTESVPNVDAPASSEPKPAMTKAQAAVAARIAAAQKRTEASARPAGSANAAGQGSVAGASQGNVAEASRGSAAKVNRSAVDVRGEEEHTAATTRSTKNNAQDADVDVVATGLAASAHEEAVSNRAVAAAQAVGAAQDAGSGQATASPAQAAGMQVAAQVPTQVVPAQSSTAASFSAVHTQSSTPLGSRGLLVNALQKYLAVLNAEYPTVGTSTAPSRRKRRGRTVADSGERDVVHLPLDYAVRYSNRTWAALDLMGEAGPGVTAARIARLVGCDSVEPIQQLLNGDEVPSFALVDALCRALGLNRDYLECADAEEPELPVFATVQELATQAPLAQVLGGAKPSDIYILKTNDDHQHATVLLRFGALRCLLLDRQGAELGEQDDGSPLRSAFLALVHALQEYALTEGVGFENVALSPKEWRTLQVGRTWPGSVN